MEPKVLFMAALILSIGLMAWPLPRGPRLTLARARAQARKAH
jgi:hypothetical protein